MALIVSGKDLAALGEKSLKEQGKSAGLGVILVGDNPASAVYVANKERAAQRVGFKTFDKKLPKEATFEQVAEAIDNFNKNDQVSGILLQLPLPKGLPSDKLIELIDPSKDADALHPINQGYLLRGGAKLKPCTPAGALHLIDASYHLLSGGNLEYLVPKKDLSGVNAVVVGRSILVGKPMALMLQERNATVTIAHSRTKNLAEVCRSADILVVAVGVRELITGDFIKPGSIVIDVGINRGDDGKLYGDVKFDEAKEIAGAITPVPGGVGPMTIQYLLENTLLAFEARRNQGVQ